MAGVDRRTRSLLVALCTAAVAAATVLPAATGHAEPSPSIKDVQQRVSNLHHEAEQAAERYNDARVLRDRVQRRLDAIEKRVEEQQGLMKAKQAAVGALAADTYRNGGLGSEMQLIFADNPRDFLDQATALRQISRQQANALRDFLEAKDQLEADQRMLAAQQAELAKLRKKLAGEKAQVEQRLDKAEAVLNTLKAEQLARIRARQAAAAEQASSTGSYAGPASGRARVAIDYAYDQMGEPYEWGAAGPDSWDCSGLTMMAWRQAGVSLPHSSSMQYESTRRVSRSDLQPGDLVFFYNPISHVGIYIGGGRMIHAPNESEPVSVDPISYMPYTGAGRP